VTVPSRCFLLSLSLAAALGTTLSRGANPAAPAPAPVGRSASDSTDASPYAPELEPFVRAFKPGGQDFAGQGAPLPPEEARQRFVAREGYTVSLVASEPMVRQPLDLHFDERGRLWVVQYLQYPFPAGSKITYYDQYLRAQYDKIPAPPPRHVRGADRVTILEDRDGDGTFETDRTFLEGMNLTTSVLPDHDGVWVLQSPYLVFYPDRDHDDIPDGDPEVHLSGFGIEDTHSLASNLHWGPDGWIYGATGSTTTLDIQGTRLLGQGIWRYHPTRRTFEVFAEGGGNTFSLEFDSEGRAFSGTNSGATRGLHYAQGATYVKGWTKHGPAMSPFIFGFLEHMDHEGYTQRFPQTFLLYQGGAMPELEGRVVVGMALTSRVQVSQLFRQTSTFRTVDLDPLITTDDRTFRPVDIEAGPDGAIYVADWTDLRLSHLNPADTWDKSNGRIYRIAPKDFLRPRVRDLRAASESELLVLLRDSNRELREQARRQLAIRPAAGVVEPLRQRLVAAAPDSLEALWVLNLRGELGERELAAQLKHPAAPVRRWAARLLGDRNGVDDATARALVALAAQETDLEVLSQLASSAKRLAPPHALGIVKALVARTESAADRHLPLLLWWAVEAQVERGREEILRLVSDPAVWASPLFQQEIAPRIGRRFTADQGPRRVVSLSQGSFSEWSIERADEHFQRNLDFCARLLEAAPDDQAAAQLLQGMATGFSGKPFLAAPDGFRRALTARASVASSFAAVALRARTGDAEAQNEAVRQLSGAHPAPEAQLAWLSLIRDTTPAGAGKTLEAMLVGTPSELLQASILEALGAYDHAESARRVLQLHASFPPRIQARASSLLCSSPAWASELVRAIQAGNFDAGSLASEARAALRRQKSPVVIAWLNAGADQAGAMDPARRAAQQLFETGRVGFNLSCAPCHLESGEGQSGLAPSLLGSRWLGGTDEPLIRILLHGKENPGRGLIMPPWRHLDDSQIAAIVTYVKREFGNRDVPVNAASVGAVRSATAERTRAWTDAELESSLRTATVPKS
jgi:putative membrane-bound dehydrogenase-like protein